MWWAGRLQGEMLCASARLDSSERDSEQARGGYKAKIIYKIISRANVRTDVLLERFLRML